MVYKYLATCFTVIRIISSHVVMHIFKGIKGEAMDDTSASVENLLSESFVTCSIMHSQVLSPLKSPLNGM